MQNHRRRLAVFTTHPIQYQCPLWRTLHDRYGLEVRVFFLSDFSAHAYRDREFGHSIEWSTPLLEGYEYEVFRHDQPRSACIAGPPSLLGRLRSFGPEVCLINGYVPLYYWHAALAARLLGVPVMLRTEATDQDKHRSILRTGLRTSALRLFYATISRFLAIGVNARHHYERLGVSPTRIGFSPYCIDTEFFENQRRIACRGPLRRRLGIPDDAFTLVFSGKLIAKKDPRLVLDAIAGLTHVAGKAVHAVFMGDGDLRSRLEEHSRQVCHGRAHFLGFTPQHEMGEVYANADALVLPSQESETWGLVVNEALQFGLPAIVSDRVGCAPDLIRDGITGYVFPSGQADDLRNRIAKLASSVVSDREVIAAECREMANSYSLEAAARGIRDAFLLEAGATLTKR